MNAPTSLPSEWELDRDYPHQVEVPLSLHASGRSSEVWEFCQGRSAAPTYGRLVLKPDGWWHRVRFARAEDAEAFAERFGGSRSSAQSLRAP